MNYDDDDDDDEGHHFSLDEDADDDKGNHFSLDDDDDEVDRGYHFNHSADDFELFPLKTQHGTYNSMHLKHIISFQDVMNFCFFKFSI